jgi:outer membrane autotransporter protein
LHLDAQDGDFFHITADLRIGKTLDLGVAGFLQPDFRLGIVEQINTGGVVSSEMESLKPDTGGLQALVGFGLTWQFSSAHQLILEYESAWGSNYDIPWSINLAYHLRF